MIKYIKITASSNFGNMFSVLAASAFLPFLPMAALHLILLNLIYDLSCTSLPWDNVDPEFFKSPKKWEALSITSFMFSLGPTSSVFDILTYLTLYFVVCPMVTGGQLFHQLTDPAMKQLYAHVFQSGWFVESMWTQTLVIHMLRTPLTPFVKSRASAPLTLISFGGIAVVSFLPYTVLGTDIGLAPLPGIYFLYLIGVVAAYMALVTVVKKWYIRKYGVLL
jgi:Mg2+-importing ATPase